MAEEWPSPHHHEPYPLPRVEDLPNAWEGYDRERVQAAFDAFYRHIAQLDSTLRALESVDVFHQQAADLRTELRALRAAGWAPAPRGYAMTPERSMFGAVPDAVPRIALEVVFLVVVAAVVAVAEFSALEIVGVMAGAVVLTFLVELIASRDRRAPTPIPPAGRVAPAPPPPRHVAVIEQAPRESSETDEAAAVGESAQTPTDELSVVPPPTGEVAEPDELSLEEEVAAADDGSGWAAFAEPIVPQPLTLMDDDADDEQPAVVEAPEEEPAVGEAEPVAEPEPEPTVRATADAEPEPQPVAQQEPEPELEPDPEEELEPVADVTEAETGMIARRRRFRRRRPDPQPEPEPAPKHVRVLPAPETAVAEVELPPLERGFDDTEERRWKPLTLAAALAVAGAAFGVLSADTHANGPSPKIGGRVLRETASGRPASFVVVLRDRADLSAAYRMKDEDARGWYVYRTLKAHAARTQAPLLAQLRARGVKYRSFWAANVVVTEGDRALVEDVAERTDVRSIESNDASEWIRDVDEPTKTNAHRTVSWGVDDVQAPAVWSAGFKGEGIVVASADTGVRWTHSALKSHYRGWNGRSADHNYNWHDAIHAGGGDCGHDTTKPCDDSGHGTHTTGTMAGDDAGGNQVGVAPGAKWIGCRNMDQGLGKPSTYTECFQFFIAPTDLSGRNADPSRRPHVINNSWGCPVSEGCAANTLQSIVQNTEAAGIFVEASAGNAGPGCNTVDDPPAIYPATFSTGAVDVSNNIAGFSSRGPVIVDGSSRIKPDIVAPGVGVRSATNASDVAYGTSSGTSMAGPHVVGVVALLWSARPDLVRKIAATKQLVTSTANPRVGNSGTLCGGATSIPNNHFGWGLVDARAAYSAGTLLSVVKSGDGTVTSAPAGINCPVACSSSFPSGTAVTLTAVADAGSTFSGWGGECSGSAACTVTMNGSHSITATFGGRGNSTVQPVSCAVPQVKRKVLVQARRAIVRGNCSVGRVTRAFSRTVAKGRIISQRPAAGARRAVGTKVALVVSNGKAKRLR